MNAAERNFLELAQQIQAIRDAKGYSQPRLGKKVDASTSIQSSTSNENLENNKAISTKVSRTFKATKKTSGMRKTVLVTNAKTAAAAAIAANVRLGSPHTSISPSPGIFRSDPWRLNTPELTDLSEHDDQSLDQSAEDAERTELADPEADELDESQDLNAAEIESTRPEEGNDSIDPEDHGNRREDEENMSAGDPESKMAIDVDSDPEIVEQEAHEENNHGVEETPIDLTAEEPTSSDIPPVASSQPGDKNGEGLGPLTMNRGTVDPSHTSSSPFVDERIVAALEKMAAKLDRITAILERDSRMNAKHRALMRENFPSDTSDRGVV